MKIHNIRPKLLSLEEKQKLYDKSFAKAYAKALSEPHSKEYAWAIADNYAERYVYNYAIGLAEGEAEANIETARKMKADGMSAEIIAKYTGLSKEEIEKI